MSLVVVRAMGLCTIQDLGRHGCMHEAVPPGGALVRERLVAANRHAHNADDARAIEILGQLVVRAGKDTLVATDRDGPRTLRAGEELAIDSEPMRCTYLALRGGIAEPAALLCAGLGAPLRAGPREGNPRSRVGRIGASRRHALDRLTSGHAIEALDSAVALLGSDLEEREPSFIGVVPGPDLDAFAPGALEALVSAPYRILPSSDRVGTRLSGSTLARRDGYREQSRPMVIGAIEVPRDGQPIVLGPEHPTTGGYPILAVVKNGNLGRFFEIRLGGSVRFENRGRNPSTDHQLRGK